MPRPRVFRRVWCEPCVSFFKPAGIPLSRMEHVVITVEELEAIRLVDHEGLRQTDAAKKMNISQPTLQRIYDSARRKIADSLVNGKAIRIEGGHYTIAGQESSYWRGRRRRGCKG